MCKQGRSRITNGTYGSAGGRLTHQGSVSYPITAAAAFVFPLVYFTADGTGVRDYIHVMDLAEGHLAAMEKLTPGVEVLNLGTGRGTTVLELVRAFEEATGVKIPYRVIGRRPGDVSAAYADVSKAEEVLGWKAKRDLAEMCKDAWGFEKGNKD